MKLDVTRLALEMTIYTNDSSMAQGEGKCPSPPKKERK